MTVQALIALLDKCQHDAEAILLDQSGDRRPAGVAFGVVYDRERPVFYSQGTEPDEQGIGPDEQGISAVLICNAHTVPYAIE